MSALLERTRSPEARATLMMDDLLSSASSSTSRLSRILATFRADRRFSFSDNNPSNDPASCYYGPTQDWVLIDYNPDGSKGEDYSDPRCVKQGQRVISCNPDGKAAYTCQAPQTT